MKGITIDAVEFGKLLADETRQKIMAACCCRWCSVGELVEEVGVSQPTVSHHLALLRQFGLVKLQRQGRQAFYTLNQGRVVECCGRLVADFAPDSDQARLFASKGT
jgi:ArsR family transcriptional regulator